MSHLTLKRLAILGALSLGSMTQTASAQWMPFGGIFRGGCNSCEIPATICGPSCGMACAPPPVCAPPPPVVCAPPPPRVVMQPFTEARTVNQVVQRPVCETRYVNVPETAYRTEYETRTATVPTMSYQTVCETQTRQRDCGRWVTSYKCRPQVAPCAYDSRPGLVAALNRGFYSARMAMTPAVVAERHYVPNVITEQIPVTRQVAVPGTRQVTYSVPRTVAYQTTRQVAQVHTRYVAETIPQTVYHTTMRSVLVDGTTGLALSPTPGVGTAALPGYPPYGTAYGGYPYGGYSPTVAVPDPGPTRTAIRDTTPPLPIPPRGATGPRGAPMPPADPAAGGMPPAAPAPMVPSGAQVIPPREPGEEEAVEEVAQVSKTVRHTAGYRPAPQVETVSSLPSIVRVSQWSGFRNATARTPDVSVASSSKTRP